MSSPDVVFLVGAPRSGTTWLQHLLGAHPRIATPQETDLLDRYVASWLGSWRRQLADSTGHERRPRALPAVLTEKQFLSAVLGVVERSTEACSSASPEHNSSWTRTPTTPTTSRRV